MARGFVWLDEHECEHPDRLWGVRDAALPLVDCHQESQALAEKIRRNNIDSTVASSRLARREPFYLHVDVVDHTLHSCDAHRR
jgi:hypothetical protein